MNSTEGVGAQILALREEIKLLRAVIEKAEANAKRAEELGGAYGRDFQRGQSTQATDTLRILGTAPRTTIAARV